MNLIKETITKFSGKTFSYVSLTRFFPVGCQFFFFKSAPIFKKATREDLLTTEGTHKFINFVNSINLSGLLVSGGAQEIINRTLKNLTALFFIKRDAHYRDRIISEVNQIAAIRSKAVNIRDDTGAPLFNEWRTRLYYLIRMLQDYSLARAPQKGFITDLVEKLRDLLLLDKQNVINAYHHTSDTIASETEKIRESLSSSPHVNMQLFKHFLNPDKDTP